jgi:hypothetical protein
MKVHRLSIPVLAFAVAAVASSAAMAEETGARLPQTASSYGQGAAVMPVPAKAETVPMKAADKAATFSSNSGFGASIFPSADNYAWWKDR